MIIIACEESQRVCKSFRDKGFCAYSCDIIPTSGDNPEWHIINDIRNVLVDDVLRFTDLIIAFPPCTYLTVAGCRYWKDREKEQKDAFDFFMWFVKIHEKYHVPMAIENPVGYVNSHYRKPDQIINPYQFGDPFAKRTCLWLFDLPKLKPTNILDRPKNGWQNQSFDSEGKNRGFTGDFRDPCLRSKTFIGIADAMAIQWGNYIKKLKGRYV